MKKIRPILAQLITDTLNEHKIDFNRYSRGGKIFFRVENSMKMPANYKLVSIIEVGPKVIVESGLGWMCTIRREIDIADPNFGEKVVRVLKHFEFMSDVCGGTRRIGVRQINGSGMLTLDDTPIGFVKADSDGIALYDLNGDERAAMSC